MIVQSVMKIIMKYSILKIWTKCMRMNEDMMNEDDDDENINHKCKN